MHDEVNTITRRHGLIITQHRLSVRHISYIKNAGIVSAVIDGRMRVCAKITVVSLWHRHIARPMPLEEAIALLK